MKAPEITTYRTRQRIARLGVLMLSLYVLVRVCAPHTSDAAEHNLRVNNPNQTDSRKATKMTVEQVLERIQKRDWDVVEPPNRVDSSAAPSLAALLDHHDREVRELTVHALHQAGGGGAGQALIKALDDADDMVRGAACRFLRYHVNPDHLVHLLPHISRHEDEYVREHVALVIGGLGNVDAIKPLRERFEVEDRAHAKHAMSLALARLGDPVHRQAYVARIEQNDPKGRAEALEDLVYLDDKTLVQYVRPLLDDQRDAKNVGPSHGPYWIRVCDVAINVIDRVLDHPFPFDISGAKQYSAQEIAQAKDSIP